MSEILLPPSIARLLKWKDATNRSLVFDRGYGLRVPPSGHEGDRQKGDEKGTFLAQFRDCFAEPPGFAAFLERRRQALELLGARCVKLTTLSRLVIGLGLPNPVETGFLFDRLTGSPYLPGSSLKGLLRASARLVADGELEVSGDVDAAPYFKSHLNRIFGPELGTGASPARGELVFYDAFPQAWPRLDLDVLTPHQGDYYGNSTVVPADWHQPVPVTFLTIAPNTGFAFYMQALARTSEEAAKDLELVDKLLCAALDWLGAGGKRSAGYGSFEMPATEASAALAPRSAPETLVWSDAALSWLPNERRIVASYGSAQATTKDNSLLDALPDEAREQLTRKKRRKTLNCEVTVRKRSERWFEMIAIRLAPRTINEK